jgi:arylsulfatase A-like enzyme
MSNRPNIVFILPDQLRPDFLSTYGASFIDTPNIDKIAEEGSGTPAPTQASPVCVPARSALLTGMNAIRNGVSDNLHRVRSD